MTLLSTPIHTIDGYQPVPPGRRHWPEEGRTPIRELDKAILTRPDPRKPPGERKQASDPLPGAGSTSLRFGGESFSEEGVTHGVLDLCRSKKDATLRSGRRPGVRDPVLRR